MNLLFLFASIGVLNGFVVSIYLLFKHNRSVSEVYFGGLLMVVSIRIGKSILYYFDLETDYLIRQVGLSFCLFIGPLFYLFIKSKLEKAADFEYRDHWLLITLAVAIVLLGIVYPYRIYPEIWNGVIIYFIYGTWLLFTALALGLLIINGRQALSQSTSFDRFYLLAIVISYLFITLTYQVALLAGVFYIWGSLVFTTSFYILLGRMLTRKKEFLPKLESQPLEGGDQMIRQVKAIMETERLFLKPQLKLEDLAQAAQLSRHLLSRLLNEAYPHGFSQFVKEYRVAEAKQLIRAHPEWSLEGIGHEAGFSSRSSFFEAFKKVESMTPAMFKKTLSLEISPE